MDALRAGAVVGWRRHASLPGRPDFYFPKARVALFVHGCFWHGCPRCQRRVPATNASFWRNKIQQNCARDRRNARLLRSQGIAVLTVWEHDLRGPSWLTRVRRWLDRSRDK